MLGPCRGTLEVMLHRTVVKRWDIKKLLLIIRSIAGGVHYLHTRSPPILHRDLKPGNLFVGANQVSSLDHMVSHRWRSLPALRDALDCAAAFTLSGFGDHQAREAASNTAAEGAWILRHVETSSAGSFLQIFMLSTRGQVERHLQEEGYIHAWCRNKCMCSTFGC